VCEYTSDFEQATYLALLEHHAEKFAALTPEERTEYVEKLAKSIAWKQVYRMKFEVPLDRDRAGSEGSSLESELIERIDRQRAATPPEEQTETKYERMHRLLGAQKADWMLDYENHRYDSAKTSAERVRYCRLRKKLDGV
jgi:histone acetyltransferase (RNA polymerase elongator complex component)